MYQEYPDHFKNDPKFIQRRRSLRRRMTGAELEFWFRVRNKQIGYKFRRQFSILNYIVDFYCHSCKLIVEIDGITHQSEAKRNLDAQRDKVLHSLGYTVIRFTDNEVIEHVEDVIIQVWNVCERLSQHA